MYISLGTYYNSTFCRSLVKAFVEAFPSAAPDCNIYTPIGRKERKAHYLETELPTTWNIHSRSRFILSSSLICFKCIIWYMGKNVWYWLRESSCDRIIRSLKWTFWRRSHCEKRTFFLWSVILTTFSITCVAIGNLG